MIWENKVNLIVMLCPENGQEDKEECSNYWMCIDQIGEKINFGPERTTDLF